MNAWRKTKGMSLAALLTVVVISSWFTERADAQSTDTYLTDYIEAINARMPPSGDPSTVAALFTDDGSHYQPFGEPPGGPFTGRAALANFFGAFKDWAADWKHIEKRRLIQGNRAVWEGVAEGHDKQTGKPVRLPIVFVLEFNDQGQVREKTVYFDVHMYEAQVK